MGKSLTDPALNSKICSSSIDCALVRWSGWQKAVQECKRESEHRFIYHECRTLSNTVLSTCKVCVSSLDEAVVANRELFGGESLDFSYDGFVLSVMKVLGDD